nr:MAG TPA: hypothetical protein [Caudoviricetes sp.]
MQDIKSPLLNSTTFLVVHKYNLKLLSKMNLVNFYIYLISEPNSPTKGHHNVVAFFILVIERR